MSAEAAAQPESGKSGMFAPLAGRWQAPMLAIAMLAFGAGILRVVVSYEPLTFEQKCAKLDALESKQALTRAHAYVLYILKDPELPDNERAILHRRLVGIVGDVLAPEPLVDIDGGVDRLHDFRGALRKAPAPHLVLGSLVLRPFGFI